MNAYIEAVSIWNSRISLVGPGHMREFAGRANDEADRLNALMPSERVPSWTDLGSGAGLPAIPLAIARRPVEDGLTLVEADRRKAAFLRHALRVAGVSGTVLAERIEGLEPLGAGLITVRALAPLDVLARHAERHLAPGGRLLALKGRNVGSELDIMQRAWTADVEVHSGAGETVIVELSNIRQRSPGSRDDA